MAMENKEPEIRFEGFSGGWEKYPLATFIGSLDAGVSVNSADRPANTNEFGILKTSCVTNGFFESNENKVVFKTKEINRLKEAVLGNTIIISRMNTPALVGANAYIGKSYANYYLPDRLWAAKPTSFGDLKFIAYILGSDKGRLALSGLATGTSGSMKNISKSAVLRLEFRAPEEKEQTTIGNTLQRLDTLINQHQQKHDKLSNLKKAMLEKMFPKAGESVPEIRFDGFSGDWFEVQLGEIAKIKGRLGWKSLKQNEYISSGPAMIAGKHIRNGHIDWNKVDHIPEWRYIESPEIMLKNDDVIFSKDGSLGNPVVVENLQGKATINSTMMLVRPSNNLDSNYFYQVLNTKVFKDLIKEKVSGSSIPHLFQADMKQFKFYCTSLEEQYQIGVYFKKLDTLINQHNQQITKLKNIKHACLDKMFV
ncbi:hypothetical protein BCU17_22005 [Vibrio splendidus]|uniref:Type I restriction modification DNA specificity domain-containing protein n=1 Tax=Vibrio splendidus TaxID=29497 RepID=A0A2N7F9F8_VIBSP|nr:restriction endonuclease subunit S [Vibrio splendidus]PMJ63804.1 hypothetical protein BCU17_22005 [Vibrio splendidus]